MVWSESGKKSAQIKHRLQAKTVQNSSKQICVLILMWETTGDGLFHWRKRYYGLWTSILVGSNGLKLKPPKLWICFLQTHNFCLLKTLIKWCGVMFLSAVWTLILTAPIHCRASIAETVMECFISPNLMKKQNYLLDRLMRTFSAYLNFWVN